MFHLLTSASQREGLGRQAGGALFGASAKPEITLHYDPSQSQALAVVRACQRRLPGIRQIGCFDTAFHRDQPRLHQLFALPRALGDEGILRYGFHGLSYAHIARRLREREGEDAGGRAIVSTNYRPYEAVILHLVTQVQPDIPVLWVDHGYNRPATYKHAEQLKAQLKLNIKAYLPKFTAAHYPNIDADLLMTGVILHDIGKIYELEFTRAVRYGDQGQLLGHIQIGIQMVTDQIHKMPDFPPRLRDLVVHLILSHHGKLEFGSPKLPAFPEALLLHYLDDMDSKMECMRALLEKDAQTESDFTGWSQALERTVLKKDRYLAGISAPAVPATATEASSPEASSPFGAKLESALKGEKE